MMARLCALTLLALALTIPTSPAQEGGRAGVVVRTPDGDVTTMCLLIDDDETSGVDLLRASGIEVVTESFALGSAVCRIDGEGCGSNDCFCGFPDFWSYWTKDPGQDDWSYSEVGGSDRRLRDGSLDAWSWGDKLEPPPVTFDEVCAAGASVPIGARRLTGRPDIVRLATIGGLLVLLGAGAIVLRRRRAS